jgi:hypothetical protein
MSEAVVSTIESGAAASPPEIESVLRGIPDSTFTVSEHEVLVPGNSGKSELRVKMLQDRIQIVDTADIKPDATKDFFFGASVTDGMLSFEIRTRRTDDDDQVQRHPDLYARDLMIRALEYFDRIGTEITSLQLNWHPTSGIDDNYRTFMSHFPKGGTITPELVTKAIFATWSGKRAWELGFREVIPLGDVLVDERGFGDIIVQLKRTEKVSIQIKEDTTPKTSEIHDAIKGMFA